MSLLVYILSGLFISYVLTKKIVGICKEDISRCRGDDILVGLMFLLIFPFWPLALIGYAIGLLSSAIGKIINYRKENNHG